MEFVDINDLRDKEGLRLVLVAGAPSPWGQAAKAMIEYKGLMYAAGLQVPGGLNESLVAWSGVNSGPVVAWNDETPINTWLDILNLIERLAPQKPLLPQDRAARVEAIGLSNEICGEQGLGWNRRHSMFRPAIESGEPPEGVVRMSKKYGYNESDVARAPASQIATLDLLGARLRHQREQGSDYFVGGDVTAVDFYWAAFSILMDLPPAEKIPLPSDFRPMFEAIEADVKAAIDPILIEHRDGILDRFFRLPMEF